MSKEFVFTPKSSYAKDELVACGMGDLFGPGNAKLPIDNMLMLDRITEINSDGGKAGKGLILAELDIHKDLWFFDCHFPGDPVMPGCLGLDAMWQLVGFWLGWTGGEGKGRALGSGAVKFTGQVTKDVKLVTYRVDIKKVIRRGINLGIANATLEADGREIYTCEDLRVGLFTSLSQF